ncbi:retrovirus-related pol polyprotein from transposon TNT 1-94 [Tanacetum coccineum]
MEKLESENVSLEFHVQSLVKERENIKLEYQKLFDSIKKTRSQTQREINELIEHVHQNTYAYADVRAEKQDLLITIYESKSKLKNVAKGKSVNTKFDRTNVSSKLLCVTPINKQVLQMKNVVSKTEEKHVLSKPVTLQTSPNKQRDVNSNKNVITPGMYKVDKKQESHTNKPKHVLSLTGLKAESSVRRPLNRDSQVKNSVLLNTKTSSRKVGVYVRKNKKTEFASINVVSNKENVIDNDVNNVLKAKDVLCVSCAKNVLIPCHNKCLVNYKLNVYSKVRRSLFTSPRTPKSKDTTLVVSKTRFSDEKAQFKSLDTTLVVSKTKIAAESVKNKVDQIVLWIVNSGCSKHMTGLGHNLFSVGQFYNGDLEVAFRSKTCYVQNLEGDDLLTGDSESNLYTISISDMAASSPVFLMFKATSTKSWLWHRRLSHLNFGTINNLTKHDLVEGLPKFKYGKDHLCSACERGKSKKASHPPKLVPCNHSKLELLHMDLCGPMRVASINGKKYILVIIDDYSRFTWVYFLHTKDETPEIIKKFIAQVQLNYNAKVYKIRTDNGTEFKKATLKAHYDKLGIMQQFIIARSPQQNGVVERCNRTLVEAACTMLIFSRLSEFLWAEAVSTACFTQNRSIIYTRYNKTPYELLRGRKPNVEYFHMFGSLCYPTNDRDVLGKMKPKADIAMDSEHDSLEPVFQRFNNSNSSAESMNTPSKEDLDNLFGPMYEEYFEKKCSDMPINSAAQPTHNYEDSPPTSSIVVEEHEAPPIVTTSEEQNSPISLNEVDEFNQEDSADFDGNTVFVPYDALNFEEIESSSTALDPSNMHNFHQLQPSTHI